jgi:hypothetical protein
VPLPPIYRDFDADYLRWAQRNLQTRQQVIAWDTLGTAWLLVAGANIQQRLVVRSARWHTHRQGQFPANAAKALLEIQWVLGPSNGAGTAPASIPPWDAVNAKRREFRWLIEKGVGSGSHCYNFNLDLQMIDSPRLGEPGDSLWFGYNANGWQVFPPNLPNWGYLDTEFHYVDSERLEGIEGRPRVG